MKKNSRNNRVIGIILSLALAFGLTACGNADKNVDAAKAGIPVNNAVESESPDRKSVV